MEPTKLESKIHSLEQEFNHAEVDGNPYPVHWALIKEIGSEFKQTRFPDKQTRERLWEQFQSVVKNVKHAQNKAYKKRSAFREGSERHLKMIQGLVLEAKPSSDLIESLVTFGLSDITKGTLNYLLGESDEELENLKYRSAAMKKAWSYFTDHKDEMLGRDKHEAYQMLRQTNDQLQDDWSRWKQHRQEIFDKRDQARKERQREWEEKQAKWYDNQVACIERLEGVENKLEATLYRRKNHLEELQDKHASAWSEDFRDRVSGWMEEELENISDICEKLEDVRTKLSEAKERLNS